MRRTATRIGRLAALLLALGAASSVAQAAPGSTSIDWVTLGLGFLGGLALFLYGVDVLANELKEAGGGRFQKLLRRSADNRFAGLASGTVATVALDSSSVVIILLIAIIDAGLISFAQGLPIILGANIGTTISSQVFAWSLDRFAPILIAGGLVWRILAKQEESKRAATIVLAIGIILFGLFTIGAAAEPLADNDDILAWLRQLERPLLGVLAGALVTVAIQSSSAMLGIVITLAGGGVITLPAGIAMMLGAEIGTCADTLFATIGRSRSAVKAGVFHLAFNIVSVTIGVLLVDQLAGFALASASNTGQQIANAHVLFNVVGALLFLPLVAIAARVLERVIPERESPAAPQLDAKVGAP